MTRREFFQIAAAAAVPALPPAAVPARVTVPIRLIFDSRVKWRAGRLHYFWWSLWRQTVRDFESCGVHLEVIEGVGDIWRPYRREPVISGLDANALNVVVTDTLPILWDRGLALCGVTMTYRGFHLCVIALERAHTNEVPLLSLNTCNHEILHALLGDVFERRPKGVAGQAREFRIDCYATLAWLFPYAGAIRKAAYIYVNRLR